MTSPYSPPAELVERVARAICIQNQDDDGEPDDALFRSSLEKGMWRNFTYQAQAAIAASGLGEVVEVLRKALSLVDDYKVATDAEKAIAEEVRALLARLETRV